MLIVSACILDDYIAAIIMVPTFIPLCGINALTLPALSPWPLWLKPFSFASVLSGVVHFVQLIERNAAPGDSDD